MTGLHFIPLKTFILLFCLTSQMAEHGKFNGQLTPKANLFFQLINVRQLGLNWITSKKRHKIRRKVY